ncbi:MAG: beta-lactamase hydrolase domain-containing protein [Sulfitobacter sp.]
MENTVKINANYQVAKFAPDASALRQAAAEGFRSVVNFRTAQEQPDLAPDEEGKIAAQAGVSYLHYPVAPDALDHELVEGFRHKLADLPTPILFHCASGKRAGAMVLMALAANEGLDGEAVIAKGQAQGLELSQEKIGNFVKSYADRYAKT